MKFTLNWAWAKNQTAGLKHPCKLYSRKKISSDRKTIIDTKIFTLQLTPEDSFTKIVNINSRKTHCHCTSILACFHHHATRSRQLLWRKIRPISYKLSSWPFSYWTICKPKSVTRFKAGIFFFITSGVVFPFRSIIFNICKSRSTYDAKNKRWLTVIVVKALWLVYFSQRAGFPTCECPSFCHAQSVIKKYWMRRIWRKPSELKYQTRFLKIWFFLRVKGFV